MTSGILSALLIWADRPTRLQNTWFGFLAFVRILFSCVPLSERTFLYDIMSGSLKMSFNKGYRCIK